MTTIYSKDDTVEFTSVIRHADNSFGEGAPGNINILYDPYLDFLTEKNTLVTNYTGGEVMAEVNYDPLSDGRLSE